jgi:glycosyltransferase involved in cell wall biosynthesis
MRVLYLSQYFPPEVGATQSRAYDLAHHWVRAGHRVTVVAEFPNHPSGVLAPGYRRRLYERTTLDGMDVVRVWVKASPVKTFVTRMAFYLSYMCTATLAGLWLSREKYDVVFAASPPLFVGAAGLAISRLRRIQLVFEVQDEWPEAAVALGELRSPTAIRLAEWLADRCYRRARRVVVVTRAMREHLQQRPAAAGKLVLIPNGANTELFQPWPDEAAALRARLGLDHSFVAVYAGIHGIAQGLNTVLDAAQRLRALPDVTFLLVGEGPVKSELVARARQLGLPNLHFHPEVARSQMPGFLTAANVALVPLRRLPVFHGAVPSKLFDAWACACPVVLGAEGEARELLEAARAGVAVEPENGAALADAIVALKADPTRCRQLGENGRRFVASAYSRQAHARELAQLLQTVSHEPS